jgi:surfactin synthase thioesterase subunit
MPLKNHTDLFDAGELRSTAPYRCFCFPHAGGGHGVFSQWDKHAGSRLAVIGVRLPGRGASFVDPPYERFESLLEDLQAAIHPFLERPLVLFGHSLGALIAYELARRIHPLCGSNLAHLFVSGCRAPHSRSPASALVHKTDHCLEDAALVSKLSAIGGIPQVITGNVGLMKIYLRAVRADFRVYDTYSASINPGEGILPCSLTAFGGLSDLADVPEWSLRAWSGYTRREFGLKLFAGGHFFLHDQIPSIVSHVLQALP